MKTNSITREALQALHSPTPPSGDEISALERLISIAKSDTGQSRRVADFLLAWWNSASCGGFDLTDLWGVDAAIAQDMVTIFRMLTRIQAYPESGRLSYGPDFHAIVKAWRPDLLADPNNNGGR